MTIVLSAILLFSLISIPALIIAIIKWRNWAKRSKQIEQDLSTAKLSYEDKISQLSATIQSSNGEIRKLSVQLKDLDLLNQQLSKYAGVLDADTKAAEILQTAQSVLDKANDDSIATVAKSQQEAKSILNNAQAAINRATSKAAEIVQQATTRAEEIAGDAYKAMNNAALFEKTVKAMKNIIEGYGDQYLVPGHSLLDDLAEGYGHTQAGLELKEARERSKLLLTSAKVML